MKIVLFLILTCLSLCIVFPKKVKIVTVHAPVSVTIVDDLGFTQERIVPKYTQYKDIIQNHTLRNPNQYVKQGDIISYVDNTRCLFISKATLQEFQELKGVGPILAQRIVDYRNQTPFLIMEDILFVKGIGPAFLKKNKDLLCL